MNTNRPTLRRGNKGADVKHAQNQLLKVGDPTKSGTPAYHIRTTGGADGHFGTGTHNATVAYQRIVFPEQLSEHDGIIGPKTWRKLGVNVGDQPAGISSSITPPEPEVNDLAANVVAVAEVEHSFWSRGKYQERDSEVTSRLQSYWQAVGWNPTAREIRSFSWQSKNPWSAAFISWVMKEAGAGTAFKYSSAHWKYVADAKQNFGNDSERFWAFDARTTSPQLGDLVCRARANSGLTFDTVQNGGFMHCDIVTEVNGDHIIVIGGNTGDHFNGLDAHTVGRKKFSLKNNGHLATDHFAIVQIIE